MHGWALLIAGSVICLLNFYRSVLRYPIQRALGRSAESYRWASGIPVLGSVAVVVAWIFWTRHEQSRALDLAAGTIALLDTGGIHWFIAALIYQWLKERGKSRG
jgi:hypothetical protein